MAVELRGRTFPLAWIPDEPNYTDLTIAQLETPLSVEVAKAGYNPTRRSGLPKVTIYGPRDARFIYDVPTIDLLPASIREAGELVEGAEALDWSLSGNEKFKGDHFTDEDYLYFARQDSSSGTTAFIRIGYIPLFNSAFWARAWGLQVDKIVDLGDHWRYITPEETPLLTAPQSNIDQARDGNRAVFVSRCNLPYYDNNSRPLYYVDGKLITTNYVIVNRGKEYPFSSENRGFIVEAVSKSIRIGLEVDDAYRASQLPTVLIQSAQAGHPDALNKLVEILTPVIRRRFRYETDNVDDLTQETLIDLLRKLPGLNLILTDRLSTPLDVLSARAGGFARMTLKKERHKRLKQQRAITKEKTALLSGESPTTEKEPTIIDFKAISDELQKRLAEFLSPREIEIINLTQSGESIDQIADKLNIKPGSLISYRSGARKKVEKELFDTVGLKPFSHFGDILPMSTMLYATKNASMQAVMFMGVFYTTDAWIKSYQQRRNSIDPVMLEQGYLLLGESTTPLEYSSLTQPEYDHLVRRHKGRLYIKSDDLAQIRETRSAQKKSSPINLESKGLMELATSPAEYTAIVRAVRKGKMEYTRKGRKILTTQETVDEWRKNHSS